MMTLLPVWKDMFNEGSGRMVCARCLMCFACVFRAK